MSNGQEHRAYGIAVAKKQAAVGPDDAARLFDGLSESDQQKLIAAGRAGHADVCRGILLAVGADEVEPPIAEPVAPEEDGAGQEEEPRCDDGDEAPGDESPAAPPRRRGRRKKG